MEHRHKRPRPEPQPLPSGTDGVAGCPAAVGERRVRSGGSRNIGEAIAWWEVGVRSPQEDASDLVFRLTYCLRK